MIETLAGAISAKASREQDIATIEARPVLDLWHAARVLFQQNTTDEPIRSWHESVGWSTASTEPNTAGFQGIHVIDTGGWPYMPTCYDEHGHKIENVAAMRIVITPDDRCLEVLCYDPEYASEKNRESYPIRRYLCLLDRYEFRAVVVGDVSVETMAEPSVTE